MENYPFPLVPLPYAYNALEPYIDEKTMRLHHDKHLQTYISNLNAAIKDYPDLYGWSLELLLYYIDKVPEKIRTAVVNNGGGVYNHYLFFAGLQSPKPQNKPSGALAQSIDLQFGGFEVFKKEFKAAALNVFGSGYTWLCADRNNRLQIVNTKNQDTVLPLNLFPVLLIDVWEHAYYLKHHNKRADYIDDWFNVVNWDKVAEKYMNCMVGM